jgi:CHAT domain-containing protein/Tfp pilus assembly protein PilF
MPRLLSLLLLILGCNCALVFCQVTDLTASDQYRHIGQLLSRRDYVQAIVAIKELIERAPEFEHAYEKLATAADAAGQLNESEAWLETLLLRSPPNNAAHLGIALIAERKKNYAAAIKNYEQYLNAAPDSEMVTVSLIRAYYTAGRIAEAEPYLRAQLAAHPSSPTPHLGLGYYLIKTKRTEEAIREFDAALSLNARTTDACYYKMMAWYSERRYGKVLEVIALHRSAFESDPDEERMMLNLNFIGAMYRAVGQYSEALVSFEKARVLAERLGDLATEENALSQTGSVWLRQDYYYEALASYQRGLEIAKEIHADDDVSRHLGNIGWIYFLLGSFSNALERYDEALELARKAGDRTSQANTLLNIGKVLVADKRPDQAVTNYEQALKISVDISNPATQSTALDALGSLYLQSGDYDRASVALQQALRLADKMSTPELQATTLNNLGEMYLRKDDTRQAIESFEQARGIAAAINNLRNVWKANAGLANAYEKLGQLDKAHVHYERAIQEMEGVRARLGGEEDRSGYFQDKIGIYKRQIALLLDLKRKDPRSHYDAEAFQVAERARARAFLDLLAEAKLDVDQNTAPDLVKQRQELQLRVSDLTAQLIKERSQDTNKQDKSKIEQIEKGLGQADAKLGDWLRELRRRNPRYASLKYPQPITLAETQRMLDAKTVLLSYSLGEPDSFLFAVSYDDFEVRRLPPEAKINADVQKFLTAITDKNNPAPEEYRRQAANLSRQLLQPISQMLVGKNALVIVADGALHRLPFETLLLPGATLKTDLQKLPFLIRRFAISYAPSASVLAELENETRETAPKEFIAFGDPVYDQRNNNLATLRASSTGGQLRFERLPYSHIEIDGIAKLFAAGDREIFLGVAASEENVKAPERLSHYRIVHFSTHGYINEARPRFSALVLSLPPRGSPNTAFPKSEDGLLSAYEIFNLKLKADLVVLSACETGLGKEVRGEGLMSLMRAFMYAGTPSVVVSLWNVNDESSADLMIRFYRNLKTGRMSKGEALRQAQLETIRDNGFPFFWAPFVLIGKP